MIESGWQRLVQPYCVVVRPKAHEKHPGLLVQHGFTGGGHPDAVCAQRLDHRVDLAGKQDEIAGDRGLTFWGMGFPGARNSSAWACIADTKPSHSRSGDMIQSVHTGWVCDTKFL